jgi:hypothetical protein
MAVPSILRPKLTLFNRWRIREYYLADQEKSLHIYQFHGLKLPLRGHSNHDAEKTINGG